MFTGIVTGLGRVRAVEAIGCGRDMRAEIVTPTTDAAWADTAAIPVGASIACAGCCLTAVALGSNWFAVQISAETLSRTTLGAWTIGTQVNLERPLRVGDELGGHIVAGHVDGLGRLVSAETDHGSTRLTFSVPVTLARFIAEKGSIAIDGVSLTINEVGRETFGVNIIPHTQAVTSLGALRPGDAVNIEIDTVARYVARLQEYR